MSYRKNAFTLVELLVVVAIISILMTLLLPALRKVRASAVQSKCASNLKQCAIALQMYYSDYDNHFPLSRVTSVYAPQYYLQPYVRGSEYSVNNSEEAGVFFCPADSYRENNTPSLCARSYAYNFYTGDYRSISPSGNYGKKIIYYRNPQRFLYFTDGYRQAGSDVRITGAEWPLYSEAGHSSTDTYMDLRHGNGCNILYLDSHVEGKKYMDLLGKGNTIIAGWLHD